MADLPSEKRYVETAFGPTEAEATALAFERIARTRRSVRVFTPEPLPEAVLRRCIDLAMTAPSSSNLQPWEFHWVRTPALKQELIAACMGQAAAATAAELVVCVARTRTWDRNRKRMLQFLKQFAAEGWRVPPSVYTYYEKETLLMYSHGWLGLQGLLKRVAMWFLGLTRPVMRGPFSQNDMRMWAIKSTALACQNLMLALRAEGYDSCPMEGADAVRVAKLLHLPADAEVVMTLGCGKRSDKGIYAPASRFEREWFVFEY